MNGAGAENVTDFFYNDPPMIWFSDGSSLEGNQYVELKAAYPPYDAAQDSGMGLVWRRYPEGVARRAEGGKLGSGEGSFESCETAITT